MSKEGNRKNGLAHSRNTRRKRRARTAWVSGCLLLISDSISQLGERRGRHTTTDMMENNLPLVLVVLCGFLAPLGSSQTIQRMAVRGDVRFRFATTEIMCVMSNDEDTASELLFDVTLPKDAFIANFSMEIEGKHYPGSVRKKQEARREYQAARRTGSSGALVEQSARHSNKFDVSINIAARSNVTFTLIYQELLRRRFGSYEYSVYMDAKNLEKILDYSVEIYIQDRNEIRDVRTPAMRKEIISNVVEESQNSLTQITNPSETTVYVVYRPSPEELKEQGPGWFVVQYDVDSDSAGELLVVDGYFVHFFLPPDDLPPLPLDIVFVLDISGSMMGRKLNQLKDAMRIILDDLRETDRFNILLFDGSVQVWEQSLQEASESNVDRAQNYVQDINYRGATNLYLALMRGLDLLEGSREAERVPMIFFLTDGEATAGEQDPAKIVADVSRKNEGVVNIYSLAFGAGADYKLLREISAKNNAFARKIYEDSDSAEQVLGLYREISTIVIRGLTVSYHSTSNNDDGDDGSVIAVDNSTITICDLSLLYGKSDFVVAGKLANAEALLSPEKVGGLQLAVSGLGAKQQVNFVLEENDLSQLTLDGNNPFWSVPRDLSKFTERAWAFLLLKQLLKEKVAAAENPDLVKELDERILDLSLKYHFVTPLTSMVVTRPEDGLRKNESAEASFTADDDVPAAKKSHVQAAYSSPRRQKISQMARKPMAMSPPRRSQVAMRNYQPPHYGGHGYHPHYFGRHQPQGVPAVDDDDLFDLAHFIPPPPMTHPLAFTSTQTPPPTWAPTTRASSKNLGHFRRRKGKRKNANRAGKKKSRKGKKCIRNKRVFLESVMVHSSQMPGACVELKAARSPVRNYTLFADQDAEFSVTVAMKRRFLMGLHIQQENSVISVEVDAKGDLALTPQPVAGNAFDLSPDQQTLQVGEDDVTITVKITKKTCKVSFVSVDVDIGGDDVAAAAGKYTGIVAKAFQGPKHSKRAKRRKGKAKKKRVPRGCSGKVPADRASLVKGKFLLRYAV